MKNVCICWALCCLGTTLIGQIDQYEPFRPESSWTDQVLLMELGRYTDENILLLPPDTALELSTMEYQLAMSLRNDSARAEAASKVGALLYILERFPEALPFLVESGEELVRMDSLRKAGIMYQRAGAILNQLGMRDSAILLQKTAITYAERANDRKSHAGNLINLGLTMSALGLHDSAIFYYDLGIEIAREIGEQEFLANGLGNKAGTYYFKGELDQSIEIFGEIREVYESLGDTAGIAMTMLNMGAIYATLEEQEKSQSQFEEVVRLTRISDNQSYLMMGLSNLGLSYYTQERYELAKERLVEAIELAEELGMISVYLSAITDLGRTYLKLGQIDSAESYLIRADSLAAETNSQREICLSNLALGEVREAEKDPDEALRHYSQAYSISEELGYIEESIFLSEKLYQLNKQVGKDAQALRFHEVYVALNDSLNSEENQKALIRIEYQAEIDQEKAQRREQRILLIAVGAGLILTAVFLVILMNRLRVTRQQKKTIDEARQKAELSEQYKEQFLANMSHEIRTPMNAISGMLNILKRNPHPEAQDPFLSAMTTSTANLLVLLNDILDLSKIEAGKIMLESVAMSPAEVVNSIGDILSVKAGEKGLSLEVSTDSDVPDYIMGDPTRLNQVLTNLVGNGIKFTYTGSVSLRASIMGDMIKFEVKDTGIGIEEGKQDEIFGKFTQADVSTTRSFGGSGLGLAITSQLVDLMGGSIGVESRVGEGSTFWVLLPMKTAEGDMPGPMSGTDEELKKLGEGLRGLRVLIAEDNEFNLMLVTDDLQWYIPEVEISIAGNGKEVLEGLTEEVPDLILMDVHMPEVNGYEATQRIRSADSDYREIPVIAMTASLLEPEIQMALEAGMNDYIPKPYSIQTLLEKIKRVTDAG